MTKFCVIDETAESYLRDSSNMLANSHLAFRLFGILTSNIGEVFNSWVGQEKRSYASLALIKGVDLKLATLMYERKAVSEGYEWPNTSSTGV